MKEKKQRCLSVLQVVSTSASAEKGAIGITGPERRAANLAPLWRKHNINLTVLYPRHGALWRDFEDSGVNLVAFEMRSKWDFGAVGRLGREIRAANAKIIHTQGAAALDLAAVLAAKRCKIASAVTRPVMIEDLTNRSPISRRVFSIIDRFTTLRRCDALIAVSQNGYNRLSSVTNKERLQLIHNGVPETSSVSSVVIPEFKSDKINIGMVGHLRDYKGFDDFLLVAQKAHSMSSNLHFHIVGEGPQRADLERLTSKLGLDECVTFHGLLQNVVPVLEALDVFLFTSLREGLSVAILEAMRASLPIVATDVGGIADQVKPLENGFILGAHDIDGLTQCCLKLVNNPEKREQMGLASRTFFEEKFSQKVMFDKYAEVYRQVAEK